MAPRPALHSRAMQPSNPIQVIIDTDGGIDDAAGLWWALTDPALDLIGVTTVDGAVPAGVAARNVYRILSAAGRNDIPIGVGLERRLGPVPALPATDFIHGRDGLGNTVPDDATAVPRSDDACELLQRLCAERPGLVTVICLGPLTNIAHAIERNRHWSGSVRELVVMGGSARAAGNALPAAEFNIACDPVAAATVVAASWNQPPLMIGLDATHAATLSDAEFELLAQHRTSAARFLDAPLRFYRTHGSTFTRPDCPCHDLFAVIAASAPDLITEAPLLPISIDTAQGPAWGATIVDFRAPIFARLRGHYERPSGFHDWRVALQVDVQKFRRKVRTMLSEREQRSAVV
jgi:purine nucleosidase